MVTQTFLKVALKLMALYAGIMGALALFFQDVARFLFSYYTLDPVTTRYWGGILLVMSIFYMFISMDPERYRLFLWIGVFDLGLAMVITIIHMSMKVITITQGFVGIFVNPIFIVVLLYGLAKKPEGEVVFSAGEAKKGKQVDELPAHSAGKHPLHGK
jgi:hypothetical protein